MKARDKATGVAIVGTVETLIGTCEASQESFERDENGKFRFDYADEGTVVNWDSADQLSTEGEPTYYDANGDHVKESEIELIASGHEAIKLAETEENIVLRKYADPTEGELSKLTIEEAREIAEKDEGLIWCVV